MPDECRRLCRKYTNLYADQIEFIVGYLDKLQNIANKEKSNVFLDCLTYSGHSAIIVGEAQPQNTESIYEKPLLGMVIKIHNEPAVERGFQLGVPTVGVVAIEMPVPDKVIQSVFPIIYEGNVIATLIYEKKMDHYLRRAVQPETKDIIDSHSESILTHICEAAVVIDEAGNICYCNKEAEQLFTSLGYVDSILGMESENIIAASREDAYEFNMSGHTLQVMRFKMPGKGNRTCAIIKDLTELARLKKENIVLAMEYQEMVHSTKNNMFLLKNISDKLEEKASTEKEQQAYRDLSNRIMSLLTMMEFKQTSGEKRTDIKRIFEELGKRLIYLEPEAAGKIRMIVSGDELSLNGEITSAVVLVVYELLYNIIKHAFKDRAEGNIWIRVKKENFISWITVADDGCGFKPSAVKKTSVGLDLVHLIVSERLNGHLQIDSSERGTVVKFDIV